MAHLAEIDKGPILDWTGDNGLLECTSRNGRRKWKFCSEVHSTLPVMLWNATTSFTGQVSLAWSWWTSGRIEGKITDANCKTKSDRYFTLFEEHISPKFNALIAIVELKRLFQGSMSLEDFHTKALRLVKEAEFPEGDTWTRVLRDTIISGLASDNIQAKVIKEGKDVMLAWVMEIAWLEVSTQKHLNRMQETAKINYIQYGKGSKTKERPKPRPSGSSGSNGGGGGRVNTANTRKPTKLTGKGRKAPLPNERYQKLVAFGSINIYNNTEIHPRFLCY